MATVVRNEQGCYDLEKSKVSALNNKNTKLIIDFDAKYYMTTPERELSLLRKIKYLQILRKCNEYLKGKALDNLTDKDVETIFVSIKGRNGKPKAWTYKTYINVLRVWFKWNKQDKLIDSKHMQNVKLRRDDDIDPDELPTEEETLSIIKAATENEDHELTTLITLLAGSGSRPGSLLTMEKKQIHWHEDGALTMNLMTKTGRHQLKVHSGYACFAKKWFEVAPDKTFFVSSYAALKKRLKAIKHKLKIKKPLRFYDWRRSHAIWAFENMPPVVARTRLWNNPHSKMESVYFKVSNKSVNEAYDRATGTAPPKEESPFKKMLCWKCGKELNPKTEICPSCNIQPNAKKYFESGDSLLEDLIGKKLDVLLEKKLDGLVTKNTKG